MGLLSGSASISRYTITARPAELDFESAAFRELAAGSEVRQRAGFVPFEPEAPYRVGHARWAFRVRQDSLRADPTAVQERLKQLLKTEREVSGKPFVPARTRRRLRQLAEEELIVKTTPRSKVVECVIDGSVLWVGTTTSGLLSTVLALLGGIGCNLAPKTPWIDRGEPELASPILEPKGLGQSVLGCRFLKAVLEDPAIALEPVNGAVTLQLAGTRVTLRGAVLPDLQRYLQGDAELVSARLVVGESTFRFEALPFRVAGLRLDCERHDAWTEQLDARLEVFGALHELLDAAYARLSPSLHQAATI